MAAFVSRLLATALLLASPLARLRAGRYQLKFLDYDGRLNDAGR